MDRYKKKMTSGTLHLAIDPRLLSGGGGTPKQIK
jgi:hypothetical protein